ncbi:MAG: Relaxosome protein TraM [Lachnoclostridium sp.]|jgi:predicted nuclease with TOPRIM domain
MSDNAMFELADRLKELRDAKKAAEEELKSINAEIDDVEYRLSELMISSETQNFTRAGTMFCLSTTTRASAAAGMKEELFDALRSKGFGELIYETVNTNSLSAFVKEQIAENGDELPDWLKGLVNVFEKTTVTVRKAAR